MKRLFYLVPHIDSVQSISEDLHQQGVSDWRFHILSKDQAGLYTRQLHAASVLDRTDLPRFVERGAIAGALFAIAFMVPAIMLEAVPLSPGGWIAFLLFAIVAGGWLAGFGGISSENYRVRQFHDDIEKGEHLVMVDVPKRHERMMKMLMIKNHPEARLMGVDSSVNNPFVEADGKFHLVGPRS